MSQTTASRVAPRAFPSGDTSILLVWLILALLLSVLWALGHFPNGDADDLLKAHEVRFLLETGNIFDRTLPGILQPEPFVSHWPWIVDLPYAAMAVALRPMAGESGALSAAFFIVPLLLLAPTLLVLRNMVDVLGFKSPALVFSISSIVALGALAEFEPGRIDYHNIQMLLLVCLVWLTMIPGRGAALASGALAALALAVGLELSLFILMAFCIRAFAFVANGPDAGRELQLFGIGLAASAVVLFVAVVAPYDYGHPLCDRYSSPFALVLVAAGASFALVPAIVPNAGPGVRFLGLLLCGAVSACALAASFPGCLAGPYAVVPDYVRVHFLCRIGQEASLFGRRDFVLSTRMLYLAVMLIGAMATVVAAWTMRGRDRAWTVYCLFAIVAVVHAVLYFRYLRFMPLLAGGGSAFVLASILPTEIAKKYVSRASAPELRVLPMLPGLVLSLCLVGYHLSRQAPPDQFEGVDVVDTCAEKPIGAYRWPAGSQVLAPPILGPKLLAGSGLSVTAVPFHTSSAGIERAIRFFDPATPDPMTIASATHATHIAVCAWPTDPVAQVSRDFPLAASLAEGTPPAWLDACPAIPGSPLRVYRVANVEHAGTECPAATDR